jgi:hypothetical protein
MKQLFFAFLTGTIIFTACETKKEAGTSNVPSNLSLPYKASYQTEFTNNVSDSDLLLVLNSYKYWETGDMPSLRATMGDSMQVDGADGFKFKGLADSLMKIWSAHRDSMSNVVITMDVWLKNHSVADSMDYINTWYKEIDTYKSGKVDSAYYSDFNALKNGKITWYSSYRQNMKK